MKPSPSKLLASAEIPAFLVSNLVNIRYLTGLNMSAGLLLVMPKKYTLFVDGRYREMAERRAYSGITVRDNSRIESVLTNIRRCGVESETVTVDQFRRWKGKFKNTKFIQTIGIVEEFRREKDLDELRTIRKALSITEELLRRVPSVLRRKPTECELAWQLEVWARELGADGLAFDPIVAFGTHTSRPHHRPTSRKLERGSIIQIDVGARYRGYCADRSDVFFAGGVTRLQEKVLRAVEEARDTALDAVRPGVSTHELDRIARKVLKQHGLEEYFCHGLGHGVGLEIHEGVSVSQQAPEEKLMENEVITIEPGVYLPGRFGIRLEETVFV